MEVVIDVKIEAKSPSFKKIVSEFGYFKKITGDSNQNISYIRNATKVEFSIKPCFTGINDGLTITLKHPKLEGIDSAKRLLLSLIDTMKDDFEVFKMNRGVSTDAVNIVVELNLAVDLESGFMSTSFAEFEEHVSKYQGSGGRQSKKTPWGTATPAARSAGQQAAANRGAAAANRGFNNRPGQQQARQNNNGRQPAYGANNSFGSANRQNTFGSANRQNTQNTFGSANRQNTFGSANRQKTFGSANQQNTFGSVNRQNTFGSAKPQNTFGSANRQKTFGSANQQSTFGTTNRQSTTMGSTNRQSNFGATRQQTNSAPAAASRFTTQADKRSATLGFAASRYKCTTGCGVAAKRTAAGRPAARQSPYAPQATDTYGQQGAVVGEKRAAQSLGGSFGGPKRPRMAEQGSNAGGRRQQSAVSREQNLLTRRMRNDLSDAEAKATIQQLKSRLNPKEAKLVLQQIQETEKRELLPKQSDYVTLELKILVGALKKKSAGLDLGTSGKLQTLTTIKEETGRLLQMYMKGQVGDKIIHTLISKYMDLYRLTPFERNTIDKKLREECGNIKKRTGSFPNTYQKNVIHFRQLQSVLQNKVDRDGSVVIDFDPFKVINTEKAKAATTVQGRGLQKKVVQSRAPPDPEMGARVRMAVESVVRRRNAKVINDRMAETMGKKLMATAVANSRAETILRETWQNSIERKRFQDRRNPNESERITIMLATVVNYVKQQLLDLNLSNDIMEAVMDIVKPQPKPSDPEDPTPNIPIFPVLEKPHATERGINTRLHWMIAEIGFVLKKRQQGRMPDQEVNMMIKRIKNGVPPIYFDVVHGRFQETARDIERMAGRPMTNSRNLTCQLQVICTYARHYLMDKLPGGSPLDPAQHRNPFQYIDYNIDIKAQSNTGIPPLMGQQTQRAQARGGIQPLMGVNTNRTGGGANRSGSITNVASLMEQMDQAAVQDEKKRVLELREFAKEANIGVQAMGVRRVEKIEKDLLQKLPNKFRDPLLNHKQAMEENKGRALMARERLEGTIKWILQNIHASDVKSAASAGPKKGGIPPIVRMKGAEVLKREGMKLWNKLKNKQGQLTDINKELTRLRDRLTHTEGNVVKNNYNNEIQRLNKKYKVTRLNENLAAAVKFEATFKYVMGDDSPISKQSIVDVTAKRFYETQNASPKKRGAKGKAANQNGAKKQEDDVMIINDPVTGKKSSDQRTNILRNKFNLIGRLFKQGKMGTPKLAEIIALSKSNLYLSCDDEDELFAEVRCAWEDNGGDDLSEKRKLELELDLTAKRVLSKVEDLIEMEGDITVADVKERLSAVMSGRMIDV